jgi:Fe-S-cluster containining protein
MPGPAESTPSLMLHAAGIAVPAAAVYFAFPSGRWTFDCAHCGAQCCRGHGYSLSLAKDTAHHWTGAETLRVFASRGDKANLMMVNFKPGCFKLTEDGLCQLHLEHGFAAKPETCRLFPFNGLKLVGSYLIVEPHPHLCPLALSPVPAPLSAHDGLLDSMREGGVHHRIDRVHDADHEMDVVIGLERAIRDRPQWQDATVDALVASQLMLTARALQVTAPATMEQALEDVAAFRTPLERILGCWPTRAREYSPEHRESRLVGHADATISIAVPADFDGQAGLAAVVDAASASDLDAPQVTCAGRGGRYEKHYLSNRHGGGEPVSGAVEILRMGRRANGLACRQRSDRPAKGGEPGSVRALRQGRKGARWP